MRQLIVPHQSQWSSDFEKLKSLYCALFSPRKFRIEHIGSTAVMELAAKAIIDIDVVYNKPDDFLYIQRKLEGIGYSHVGNQGIIDREVFKRKNPADMHEVLDQISHHLYVCPKNSIELNRHIRFRDLLRNNPNLRNQYATLKMKIAERSDHDRKVYARLKETEAKAFIEKVLDDHSGTSNMNPTL